MRSAAGPIDGPPRPRGRYRVGAPRSLSPLASASSGSALCGRRLGRAPCPLAGELQATAVDRSQDVAVAAAAAVIPCQVVQQLLLAGVRVLVEQTLDGHDVARGAVAALKGALLQKGFLDRVELLPTAEALDRLDAAPVEARREGEAGRDRAPIQQHGARAADGGAAALAHPVKLELLVQDVRQEPVVLHFDLAVGAIHGESDRAFHGVRSSSRSADRPAYPAPGNATRRRSRGLTARWAWSRFATPAGPGRAVAAAAARRARGARRAARAKPSRA